MTRAYGMSSSNLHLQVVTGGDTLSYAPAKPERVVPSRAERDSEYNPLSSQAPPIVRDKSGVTRNEGTSYDPKGSIEKKNTTEQRRNATLDERNGSGPGTPSYDAHQAQHRQTTAPSANIDQPSVSRQQQPPNPIHMNDSGSPHAHNADKTREAHKYLPDIPLTDSPSIGPTVSSGRGHSPAPLPFESLPPPNVDHKVFSSSNLATMPVLAAEMGSTQTNLQPVPTRSQSSSCHPPPLSHSQPSVPIQLPPRPAPGTTIRHKPQYEESDNSRKRKRWSSSAATANAPSLTAEIQMQNSSQNRFLL
jgi:hypothetical protein